MTQAEYKAVALMGADALWDELDADSQYGYNLEELFNRVIEKLRLNEEPEGIEAVLIK